MLITYLNVYEDIENKGDIEDYDINLLNYFYKLDIDYIEKMDISDIEALIYILNIYMNMLIKKLNSVGNCGDEIKNTIKKKSAFDDYDKEEGYITEQDELENDVYYILRNNINYIIKYCVSNRLLTLDKCYEMNLNYLLDYVDFDIKYEKDNKEE